MSISRRKLITTGLAVAAGATGLAAADRIARRYGLIPPDGSTVFGPGETLTYAAQRLIASGSLAREFPRSMISAAPFANEMSPLTDNFKRLQTGGFSDWRLTIDGTVAHPMSFSVSDLRALGRRSQITEIACEEGWSYIAEWIGTPLSDVLREAGVLPQTRYIAYFSDQPDWWDSLDIREALHSQTVIVWGMNDNDLPVGFGGPLRMRVARQLGYKNVKFVTRITAADSLKPFGKGLGSASPEAGYAWYAGI
ncbi:MAG: molybdopterin-dependent oxidoreductase [Terracidiphilus sp.]|nr:molybdopterin-dependent oxidoreductase [Terracidiphilus sp.]